MKQKYEIALVANEFRKQFNIDEYSPINLLDLVANIDDLTLVEMPLSSNVSGMYVEATKNSSIIVINSFLTKGRKQFSIGHELYHYYCKKQGASISFKDIESNIDEEREADLFASYLIISHNALNALWKEYSNDSTILKLLRIEHYYNISRIALLIRLKNDKLITQREFDKYKHNVTKTAKEYGYATDIYIPGDGSYHTYGKYINMCNDLLKSGKVSNDRFNELLNDAFIDNSEEPVIEEAID